MQLGKSGYVNIKNIATLLSTKKGRKEEKFFTIWHSYFDRPEIEKYCYLPIRVKILQYGKFSNIALLIMNKNCNSAHDKKGEERKIWHWHCFRPNMRKIVKLHLLPTRGGYSYYKHLLRTSDRLSAAMTQIFHFIQV